jgi:lysophospholipase L1-like esterase
MTLTKLRAGEPVTIVAWGDSVTDGGGVETTPELRYQNQFARRLGERFPKAKVSSLTAGWGGRGSRDYLEAPRGGDKDFVRDVLEPKPDLVTIEFVNDAYLDEEQTQVHYSKILHLLRGNGSGVILITPHLVRPDWMQTATMKFDEDPRPYVRGLRRFSKENEVAIADASLLWCGLWRQGIPYITLEKNSINHPDARGHELFADALMSVFPNE